MRASLLPGAGVAARIVFTIFWFFMRIIGATKIFCWHTRPTISHPVPRQLLLFCDLNGKAKGTRHHHTYAGVALASPPGKNCGGADGVPRLGISQILARHLSNIRVHQPKKLVFARRGSWSRDESPKIGTNNFRNRLLLPTHQPLSKRQEGDEQQATANKQEIPWTAMTSRMRNLQCEIQMSLLKEVGGRTGG